MISAARRLRPATAFLCAAFTPKCSNTACRTCAGSVGRARQIEWPIFLQHEGPRIDRYRCSWVGSVGSRAGATVSRNRRGHQSLEGRVHRGWPHALQPEASAAAGIINPSGQRFRRSSYPNRFPLSCVVDKKLNAGGRKFFPQDPGNTCLVWELFRRF